MTKWKLSLIIIVLIVPFSALVFTKNKKNEVSLNDTSAPAQKINKYNLPRIAHGGGSYMGTNVTDSLEALNANANKYEIFELDFNFTSDGELICIHDWSQYGEYHRKIRSFWKKSLIPPDLKTFERLASEKQKWTNCTLNTLIKWLDDNPGKRIVTDVKMDGKTKRMQALAHIAKKYPNHIQRFIPQIYKLSEYKHVKSLGYYDIILTLYKIRKDKKKQELAELQKKNYALFAITIPKYDIRKFASTLKEINTPIYTHTVNDQNEFDLMKTFGVNEIYTDSFPNESNFGSNLIHTRQINKNNLPRIAHGGGSYMGMNVTDSLEALNTNSKIYELFELDFNTTLDGEIVCIHDWNQYIQHRRKITSFWKISLSPPDFKTFQRLSFEKQKWRNCTLKTVIKWLDDNPRKRVVTDVKEQNVQILSLIAKKYPNHIQRFIPQIYELSELNSVKALGYNNIILTLYNLELYRQIEELAKLKEKDYNLFAVTVPKWYIHALSNSIKGLNIPIYTHTVNDQRELDLVKSLGVNEIYTDSLIP